MHVFYSEAVFMAVGFWAYAYALDRRWRAVGILLALLSAARLPAVLFIALCGLEYLQAYHWQIRKIFNKQLLWFLLTPIGFFLYGIYLYVVRHDFFAMFHAYSATNDWTYHTFSLNLPQTIISSASPIFQNIASRHFTYEVFINNFIPLLALAALVVCSLYCLRDYKTRPLGIFGILAMVLFTVNSNVISVHRYVLPCLVIYCAVAIWCTNRSRKLFVFGIIAASTALQLYLYSKFVHNIFAG